MEGILDTPTAAENRAMTVVALEFWTDHEVRGGEMAPVDWVRWGKRGDMSTVVVEKVTRLQKPLGQSEADGSPAVNPVWQAIHRAYEAWKRGQDLPEDGTPLDAWAGLTKSQAKAFKGAGFRAVEHIAHMTDNDLMKVRLPDTRRVRDLARAYVTSKERDAPIAAEIAKRDARLADLEAQNAELLEGLKALQAERQSVEPARRGRSVQSEG